MSEIITVGLDLTKNVFQVHGADASGRWKPVEGSFLGLRDRQARP